MSKVGRPSKKVVCITDPQGDSFYHVFDSVNECSDYYGIKDKTVVSKVCKGELDKYKGFVFMYYDDFQNVFNELSCKSESHDIEYTRYKNKNRFEFAITIKNVPCFRGERK